MATYEIVVQRLTRDAGDLTFNVDGAEKFKVNCWEDPERRIPAKTYTGCSTTLMASKGYEAVYLPDEQTERTGIFVHQGSKPGHSDGCIVCSKSKVHEIYTTVPRNGRNVTVIVKD